MSKPLDIAAATQLAKDIHDQVVAAGLPLQGLCATAAAILMDRLTAMGREPRHVMLRNAFGSWVHAFVWCDGLYIDPTWGQFAEAEGEAPYRVSGLPPAVCYLTWGTFCTVHATELPPRWPEKHHPDTHMAAVMAA